MQTDIVLCIDVGNTRLKWAVYKLADMSILQQSVVSDLSELSFADLNSCFAAMEPKPVWVSLVSSDDVKQCLSDWFEKEWKLSVNFIEAENQSYAHLNGYKVTADLGVDRWLAMIAGQEYFKNNFCVIDAGTAITIDVVDCGGEHIGGMIMPGKQLMLTSLTDGAARIDVSRGNASELADNTADGVFSGVEACLIGGIEKVLSNIRKKHKNIKFIITGGDAEFLKQSLDSEIKLEKNLVLQGVGLIAHNAYA